MFLVLKVAFFVALIAGGVIYTFRDAELMAPLMAEIFPDKLFVHPGEPLGRAVTRQMEQRKLTGGSTDHGAIRDAYASTIRQKFERGADKKPSEDANAAFSREAFMRWQKDGVIQFEFNVLDSNNNGVLERGEGNISAFGHKGMDTDNNNQISTDEFWNAQRRKHIAAFNGYDANKDGQLTFKEYQKLQQRDMPLPKLLQLLDGNGNNNIDPSEMNNAVILFNIERKSSSFI